MHLEVLGQQVLLYASREGCIRGRPHNIVHHIQETKPFTGIIDVLAMAARITVDVVVESINRT